EGDGDQSHKGIIIGSADIGIGWRQPQFLFIFFLLSEWCSHVEIENWNSLKKSIFKKNISNILLPLASLGLTIEYLIKRKHKQPIFIIGPDSIYAQTLDAYLRGALGHV
ncbi:hypothetical protein ACJX0J_025799, partial [Zea mays]